MKNKSLYPSNWQDEIRPAILKRDSYRCTSCGINHRSILAKRSTLIDVTGDPHAIAWEKKFSNGVKIIFLQVHHIDGNRSNNDFNNLTSLCPSCHFKIERDLNRLKKISPAK